MWQATWVRDKLTRIGHEVQIVEIATAGDRRKEAISQLGGYGVFTKEIQRALLDGRIDLAVHSLKDLPTLPNQDLTLAAVPQRADPRDVLVSQHFQTINDLPPAALIGTGSLRRRAQLLYHRADLRVEGIRGNVETRLRKLQTAQFDAILLAEAGLSRLGLADDIKHPLPTSQMLPAAGQGAIGIEVRSRDAKTRHAVAALNDTPTQQCVSAERAMLAHLCAGCLAPVGALARIDGSEVVIEAAVFSSDGSQRIAATWRGRPQQTDLGGHAIAEELLRNGARDLIDAAHQ